MFTNQKFIIRASFLTELLAHVLHQNKSVNQEKGRPGGQETGDLLQQRNNSSPLNEFPRMTVPRMRSLIIAADSPD